MILSIKDAIKATGKGEATIRRLTNKIESQPFIHNKKGKIYIEANYLFSIYEAKKNNESDQIDDFKNDQFDQIKLYNKIELLEEKLKMERSISEEKDKRINDLQNAIRLLDYKKNETEVLKKKQWWKLF